MSDGAPNAASSGPSPARGLAGPSSPDWDPRSRDHVDEGAMNGTGALKMAKPFNLQAIMVPPPEWTCDVENKLSKRERMILLELWVHLGRADGLVELFHAISEQNQAIHKGMLVTELLGFEESGCGASGMAVICSLVDRVDAALLEWDRRWQACVTFLQHLQLQLEPCEGLNLSMAESLQADGVADLADEKRRIAVVEADVCARLRIFMAGEPLESLPPIAEMLNLGLSQESTGLMGIPANQVPASSSLSTPSNASGKQAARASAPSAQKRSAISAEPRSGTDPSAKRNRSERGSSSRTDDTDYVVTLPTSSIKAESSGSPEGVARVAAVATATQPGSPTAASGSPAGATSPMRTPVLPRGASQATTPATVRRSNPAWLRRAGSAPP